MMLSGETEMVLPFFPFFWRDCHEEGKFQFVAREKGGEEEQIHL